MNKTLSSSFYGVTALFIQLSPALITSATATENEVAHVMIDGSIVEAACAIGMGAPDQTLYMGNHPLSHIIRGKHLPRYTLSINLLACSLEQYSLNKPRSYIFRIMFEGEEDVGHFKNTGSARGIAVMISDHQGNIATPGKYLPAQKLDDNKIFNYTLSLISNQEILQPGDFQLTLRFRIDYN